VGQAQEKRGSPHRVARPGRLVLASASPSARWGRGGSWLARAATALRCRGFAAMRASPIRAAAVSRPGAARGRVAPGGAAAQGAAAVAEDERQRASVAEEARWCARVSLRCAVAAANDALPRSVMRCSTAGQ